MADESLPLGTKTCIKCHQQKTLDCFCKKATNRDGHDNRCRDCQKARYLERIEDVLRNKKEYYQKNRAKILEDKKEYQAKNREARKAYSRQYYIENRETFLVNRRKYYEENKEACLEVGRRWHLQNRDHVAAISKKYWEANRDRLILSNREYYANNRKSLLTQKQQYYVENKEIILQRGKRRWANLPRDIKLVINRNQKAKRKKAEGSHTAQEIKELFLRQKGKCASCKESIKKAYHADHIVPISRGGSNYIDNIQLLCPTCNLKKHAKCPFDWANENGRLL